MELTCATNGIKVYGADAFEALTNFWRQAKENPTLLSERVRQYHPLTKPKFYSLQRDYTSIEYPLERAAVFYVLNRSSFSGTTLSGGMSPGHPRFNENSIERLRDFRAKNRPCVMPIIKPLLASIVISYCTLTRLMQMGRNCVGLARICTKALIMKSWQTD